MQVKTLVKRAAGTNTLFMFTGLLYSQVGYGYRYVTLLDLFAAQFNACLRGLPKHLTPVNAWCLSTMYSNLGTSEFLSSIVL